MLCIVAGGKTLTIAATAFTLVWTHSVEHTQWREGWAVTDEGLVLVEARVKGSGAGMDPGRGARRIDGWWVWKPDVPPRPVLTLAASGETGGGWRLCHAHGCLELGAEAGAPIVVSVCNG